MKNKRLIIVVVVLFFQKGFSQQSTNASGGNISNATGGVSYSVGQVFSNTISNTLNSVSEGVHQAFEISVLGVDNQPLINLEMKVFPNPTASNLFLKLPNFS